MHNKRTCNRDGLTSRGGRWRAFPAVASSSVPVVSRGLEPCNIVALVSAAWRGAGYHRRGIEAKVQLVIFHKYVSILSPPRKESVTLEKK